MNKTETKQISRLIEFKAQVNENTIEGAAAVMGNIDRHGDVIFPGAFKKAIPSFLKSGFVAVGHAWDGLPVAMPKSAKEVGNTLMTVAEFHDDPEAQRVRQVCKERIENGLSVGLSVGFSIDYDSPDGRMWFENGKLMAKYIDESGYDQSLFDMAGIRKCGSPCRAILSVSELYEYSIVTVPANPKAVATTVKTISLEDDALNALSFEDHSNSVLTAVKGFIVRARDYAQMREEKGRGISEARASEFKEMQDALAELLEVGVMPKTLDAELLQVQAEALRINAVLIGSEV